MTDPTHQHQPPWQEPAQSPTGYATVIPPEPFTQTSRFVPLPEYLPSPRRRWVFPVVVTLALLLVGGGAFMLAWTLVNRSKPHPVSLAAPVVTTSTAMTLTVVGSFALIDPDERWRVDRPCEGDGGYSDIYVGAQVTAYDPTGKVVAIGRLTGGKGFRGPSSVVCLFFFTLEVPAGLGLYGLEVTHRGQVRFAEADLADPMDGPSLSLGHDK